MLKLIKYLKKSFVPILAIIFFLVIQAFCDLSLPDYTSNIVNVGIQQEGIEDGVPDVIRESELDKILLFVSDSDNKQKILDNYNKENDDSLSSEPVYKLNKIDKQTRKDLNNILGKPILLVSGLESDSDDTKAMKQQIVTSLGNKNVSADSIDIFKVFSSMPQAQLEKVTDTMESKIDGMPDSIINQAATKYVKSEYISMGIDTDANQRNYILIAGAKMILIALISMIASVIVGFIAAKVAAYTGKTLRKRVFGKVMDFSNTEMDKFSTASLITRSTNDIQQIQLLMVMLLRIVFYAPILGIGGIIKVFNTNASMSWIIGVAFIAIMVLVIFSFVVVLPKFKVIQKLVDRINLVTREILTGILVIRAFSNEKHEEERFDKANIDLTNVNLFVNRVMSFMMPAMFFIMNGIAVLIVWSGAHSIDSGSIQVGDMMAFIQYAMMIIMAFLMITMVSVMLPRASASAVRIDEVLTTEIVVKDKKQVKKLKAKGNKEIEFKNVAFRYPNAEEDVLSDISFTAKAGKTTAFIGSTGSGKSTLINLIPRFYDVTQGNILIDGIDVRDVNQHELRETIGYVPQKGVLFSGTIESNLKYGRQTATEEEIKKSAEIAQATEFINKSEKGLDTDISQGGTNVSGGQKQRLSIARAIAKDPNIYIFDDSFSALDYKTDAALRKALKEETHDSIVLIVAQRISTILHADQIIVMDEGKIVGKGTHKELLNNCEVYAQIASSQLSKEELENE